MGAISASVPKRRPGIEGWFHSTQRPGTFSCSVAIGGQEETGKTGIVAHGRWDTATDGEMANLLISVRGSQLHRAEYVCLSRAEGGRGRPL